MTISKKSKKYNVSSENPQGSKKTQLRVASDPTTSSSSEWESNKVPQRKPRKSHLKELNLGNALQVLLSSINLQSVGRTLGLESEDLLNALVSNVKGDFNIPFSDAKKRDLDLIHLRRGLMEVDEELRMHLEKRGAKALEGLDSWLELLRQHVWRRNEAGCRLWIDRVLLAAVAYAEKVQDSNRVSSTSTSAPPSSSSSSPSSSTIPIASSPHFSIYPEFPCETTEVGVTNSGASVSFYGTFDYVLASITSIEHGLLVRGIPIAGPPDHSDLLAIVEAKKESTFESAQAQIEAQVLTGLKLTGRSVFAGWLTNGVSWTLYLATSSPKESRVFRTATFIATDGAEEKIIVGLIVELLLDPATIPKGLHLTLKK